MTVRDLINLLETYMPDLDAPLRVKIVGSDSPIKLYLMGGENSVTILVEPKGRKEQA